MKQQHRKAAQSNRKQDAPIRQIKGIHYGKKRFRLPDPTALLISAVVAGMTAALAAISNRYGFDKTWYGDVLTTADCILCLFALLNIGYVLMEGICIENGIAFLGVDSEKQGIVFHCRDCSELLLLDDAEQPIEAGFLSVRNAELRFVLRDGSSKSYFAKYLTARKYRAICAYFLNRSN